MTWLYQLIKAVLDSLIPFLEKKANEPKTIENAQPNPGQLSRWRDYVAERLLKQGGGDRPPVGPGSPGK